MIDWYTYGLIPFLIFIARVTDVTIGTVRIILMAKGFKFIAPILGFFELLIWLAATKQIFANLTNPITYIAYAGGFAIGNFAGMVIEEKVSIGKVAVTIFTRADAAPLVKALQESRYIMTVSDSEGPNGKVKTIFMVINRKYAQQVLNIVKKHNKNAFYTVEDVRYAKEEYKEETNRRLLPAFLKHR